MRRCESDKKIILISSQEHLAEERVIFDNTFCFASILVVRFRNEVWFKNGVIFSENILWLWKNRNFAKLFLWSINPVHRRYGLRL